MAAAPVVSLCLIVRNGGAALETALTSAKALADELIVVDTGSEDDSRQIATRLGARVIEFPWCDSFSAARNCSLDHASGDWIFWMDADDELPADSADELRRRIAAHPKCDAAFWVTVEETARGQNRPRVMGHAQVKLFPRRPEIRFTYRVHEQAAPAIRKLRLPIRPTTAVVRHAHANRTPERERQRLERNLRLGLMDLEEHPDDPFVCMHLGAAYLFQPSAAETAIDFLTRAAALLKPQSPTRLNTWLYLGQAFAAAGKADREQATYEAALKEFPDDAVLLLRLGASHENAARFEDAARCYHAALARGKVRPSCVHLRKGHVHAMLRLGDALQKAGKWRQAETAYREFLARFPEEADVRRAMLDLQMRHPSITA